VFVLEALPDRERMLIKYHYFQHFPFDRVAEMMEISKSRVSQLHARALKLLREGFSGLNQFDVSF
jgi:RNA polymerase sigma factor for flagellar operon FliA